jgi:hypothetical protein
MNHRSSLNNGGVANRANGHEAVNGHQHNPIANPAMGAMIEEIPLHDHNNGTVATVVNRDRLPPNQSLASSSSSSSSSSLVGPNGTYT